MLRIFHGSASDHYRLMISFERTAYLDGLQSQYRTEFRRWRLPWASVLSYEARADRKEAFEAERARRLRVLGKLT